MAIRKRFEKELQDLIYIVLAVLILLLSIFNLKTNSKPEKQVLGTKIDNSYWEEITKKHPTYRDAWVELGRMDKVKEIDPNY